MKKKFLVELVDTRINEYDFQIAYKKMVCSESTGAKKCQSCILAKNCSFLFLFSSDMDSPRVVIENQGERIFFLTVEGGKAMEFFPYYIYGIESIATIKTIQELRTVYDGKEFSPLSIEKEVSELKLQIANLKIAVSEAIMDLEKTKRIFKSRRIARIRRDLESAIK